MRRLAAALALLLLLLLFHADAAHALVISEVMYNPGGADKGREWLEIYNNDSEAHNLTGWKLNTDGTDHTLNAPPENGGRGAMIMAPGEYAVIAQNASYVVSVYAGFGGTVIDSSWTDLSNSVNETIWIKNATRVFDNITHAPLAEEGNTTCLTGGSFAPCAPTPGAANSPAQEEAVQPAPQPQPEQNAPARPEEPAPQPEQPSAAGCNMQLSIRADDIYSAGTADFDIVINNTACSAQDVTVRYLIEDLFGNIAKPALDTTAQFVCSRTISRQWTPPAVQGYETYRIVANITGMNCTDTDAADNGAAKLIAIKGAGEPRVAGAGASTDEPAAAQGAAGEVVEKADAAGSTKEKTGPAARRAAAPLGAFISTGPKAVPRLLILLLIKGLA